jgi:hypothetical protein
VRTGKSSGQTHSCQVGAIGVKELRAHVRVRDRRFHEAVAKNGLCPPKFLHVLFDGYDDGKLVGVVDLLY